jgi:hypothetical protein
MTCVMPRYKGALGLLQALDLSSLTLQIKHVPTIYYSGYISQATGGQPLVTHAHTHWIGCYTCIDKHGYSIRSEIIGGNFVLT